MAKASTASRDGCSRAWAEVEEAADRLPLQHRPALEAPEGLLHRASHGHVVNRPLAVGDAHAQPLRTARPMAKSSARYVLEGREAAQRAQVGLAQRHRLADDVALVGHALGRDHAAGDAAVEVEGLQPRAESLGADAGHGVGHEAHLGIFQQRRNLVQVAGLDPDVGIADDHDAVAGRSLQRDELVDLRVHARLAPLQHQAHAVGPAALRRRRRPGRRSPPCSPRRGAARKPGSRGSRSRRGWPRARRRRRRAASRSTGRGAAAVPAAPRSSAGGARTIESQSAPSLQLRQRRGRGSIWPSLPPIRGLVQRLRVGHIASRMPAPRARFH